MAPLRQREIPQTHVSKRDLFEGASSGEDPDDGGAQLDNDPAGFRINQEYARRFEHNKKREERQRRKRAHTFVSMPAR